MDLKIKNKRALVLGASGGLGKATANALIREGVQVAICSRDEGRINKTAKEIGASLALVCDLNQRGSGTTLVEKIKREWGGVDILVVNTGGPPKGNFADVTAKQWEEGFQNLWLSTVETLQAALPTMVEKKFGRIILITSVAAREPMAQLTISNGLRAGLLGLTKSMSQEYARYGITINAVLPGYTDTERLSELGIPMEKITGQVPAARLGKPDELGSLVTFLSSEQASYITGQAIACDGGYLHGI